MRRSLRLRLIVWMTALLLPASVAAGWLLVRVFADRLARDVDVALTEEAETVAALLAKPDGEAMLETLLEHISEELDLGPGKRVVVRRGTTIIAESPPGAARYLSTHATARNMRVVTHVTGPGDHGTTIQIGVPIPKANPARRLTLILVVGIPAMVLLLAIGQWFVIGRTLGPLESASRQMETVGVADLTTRVPLPNSDDEVGRMVSALNRMLDRVAHSVQQMQRFTADAAHELRTPLTVLRAGLEVTLARERSPDEYRAALREALMATERLSALAEDLLALARLDAGAVAAAAARVPVDVGELLQDLADGWAARAIERNVHIEVATQSAASVRGSVADLYRLLNNLIDNAVRHSPTGGCVRLSVQREPGHLSISCTDNGPGIADGEADKLLERFYRGRQENSVGSGLGLSIAQMIARAHGGDLRIANCAGGGCIATVTLPSEPEATT